MNPADSPGRMHRFGSVLFRNWISLAGVVLAVAAGFAFLLLFALDLFAHGGNPYMGILAYLVAPGFFFLGLALVALGWWRHRRRLRHGLATVPGLSLSIDLSRAD